MARGIWTGALSFGLVNIPVEVHTAVRDTRPHFRLLHAKDRSPINYERICQKEGAAVGWDDLVKGYEYEKGRFVVLTKEDFAAAALEKTRRIDISFNLISYGDVQQPLMEISADDFSQPITAATRTHFLTTRAAARHMVRQRSGVVLMFGGSGPQTLHGLGGFKIALDAMEGQRRQWALELGKNGIRVVTMVTGGIVETIPWQAEGREEIVEEITRTAHLNRTATLEDVGNVAVFIASDRAGAITDATVNISCGAIVDY